LGVENAENHNNGKNGTDVNFSQLQAVAFKSQFYGVNQNVA
jgi:hypothetical protein